MIDLLFDDTRLATSHSIKKDQTHHPGEHSETSNYKVPLKFHYTDHTEGVGGRELLNDLPLISLILSWTQRLSRLAVEFTRDCHIRFVVP